MPTILNGKEIAAQMLAKLEPKPHTHLSVVLVGENPASLVYVGRKKKTCEALSIHCTVHQVEATQDERRVIDLIHRLNRDKAVHGILVQLPLPPHMNTFSVMNAVAPEKDVDGLTTLNQGFLFQGKPKVIPCTPAGCLQLLEHTQESIEGKSALIIGRSTLVGKPLASLLTQRNATVTLAHSYTQDLENLCTQADILVVAMGQPQKIKTCKKGAIILDVGINKLGHTLVGDVDFDQVFPSCAFITPVPGGVGPMTVASLVKNVIFCASIA